MVAANQMRYEYNGKYQHQNACSLRAEAGIKISRTLYVIFEKVTV